MADQKITDLGAAAALTGAELLELVQGGANKKQTIDKIIGREITLVIQSGVPVTTGVKTVTRVQVRQAMEIKKWKLVCDPSATVTLDIIKNGSSICASAKPAVAAGTTASSSTLTGWTTTLAEDDIVELEVEANNNATFISLEICAQLV